MVVSFSSECLSCALIFRSVLILSWTSTWFQRDPNTSPPTSQQTSPLWGSCLLAFWNTMPQTSGISQGHHHIIESSVADAPMVLLPDHFLAPIPRPLCSCIQLLFPLQSPRLSLSFLYTASSSLVSCFWVRGRSRWDLWPYTALTSHTMISVLAVCVLPCHAPAAMVELILTTQTCTDLTFFSIKHPNRTHLENVFVPWMWCIQGTCNI